MTVSLEDTLREWLVTVLRPSAPITVHQTAKDMATIRAEAVKNGLDYNALVVAACKQLKAEKKGQRS